MKHNKTRHHIIPKSLQSNFDFDLNQPWNILYLSSKIHQRLHTLFSNQEPREQFKNLLKINEKVIKKEIVNQLLEIFDLDPNEFYNLK